MALIEIPEEDGWRDDVAARVLALVLAAVILRFGLEIWGLIGPGGVVGGLPTFAAFAIGVQIMLLAAADIEYETYARPIAYATTIALAVLAGVTVVVAQLPRLGTDLLAFTVHAVDLASSGGNPFAASMAPARQLPGAPELWTPRTDGSLVESWSYPAGTIHVYAVQYLTIGHNPVGLRLTSLVGVTLIGLTVTYILPPTYALLGPASLMLAQNEFLAALGGLNDMWWVLPTVVTVWLWATDRRVLAAAVFGVACAMKQQPWAIGLPLAIWVWHDAPDARTFARRAGTYIGVGLATFALLNLPWLVTSPGPWLESVLVPLSTGDQAPLVSKGVGLAILNHAADGRIVSRATFELLIYATIAAFGLVYWWYFKSLRWTAWLFPAAVFLFTPRSLPSYFHWFLPVAIVAMFAAHGELRGQREVTPA